MATLKDVAKMASVDISTVSRALNNTSYVHPDTKARIYEAAEKLGYHPNIVAQALRKGRRSTIGVIVPRLHLAIFSEILQGIEEEARQCGYTTLVSVTEDDAETEKESLNRLRSGYVDGIIIAATGNNGQLLREIQANDIPVIQLVRNQDPHISSVIADYETCSINAVEYLYEKGCRRIGLIDGARHLIPYRDRYNGYINTIKQKGLEPNVSECFDYPVNSFEYGYECAKAMLDKDSEIDAILAAVDIQGLGAVRALKERNISVPEQVKVISLTGHEVSRMLETSITSMELPAHEMGTRITRMLLEEIEAPSDKKPSTQHVIFPATFVEREST